MMSNDVLIIENMDLSHIHLAVQINMRMVAINFCKEINLVLLKRKTFHVQGIAIAMIGGWPSS